MIIAGTRMISECARTAGSATNHRVSISDLHAHFLAWKSGHIDSVRHTNTHKDQETGTELSEIHNGVAAALHEIIRVGASSADPVWDRGEHVGSDDEER
jgi:hypothetical protein